MEIDCISSSSLPYYLLQIYESQGEWLRTTVEVRRRCVLSPTSRKHFFPNGLYLIFCRNVMEMLAYLLIYICLMTLTLLPRKNRNSPCLNLDNRARYKMEICVDKTRLGPRL